MRFYTKIIVTVLILISFTFLFSRKAHASAWMEWGTQASVDDDSWTTVNFTNTYTSPVFICTIQYDNLIGVYTDGDTDPVVCRVQNVGSTSAQVRLQMPGDGASGSLTVSETIHYLVVEEGTYDTGDIELEATTFTSTVTAENNNWSYEGHTYSGTYTNPVVLGQVMTYADTGWSVFWASNGSRDEPDATLNAGKHVAEDTDTTRTDETVGYVVFEEGTGTLGSIDYEVQIQGESIDRIDDSPPQSYTFVGSWSSAPTVGIISISGMNGGNGGHPALYGSSPFSTTQIDLTIMEDEIRDGEMTGIPEHVPYIVFESAGSYDLDPSPTFTQNDFEWFVTADSTTLTNVWPSGGGDNLAENAALTQIPATNEPLSSGDQIRIQMNITVGTTTLPSGSQSFKLQYDAAEDCTSASGWADVGEKASGTIWRLFDESSVPDSSPQVNNISTSTASAEGFYLEVNDGADNNPNEVLATENSEWDWPVENNGATENTTYCFRMVLGDDSALDTYNADSYPKLTTAPGLSNFLRHGNIFQNNTEQGYYWTN